MRIDKKEEAKIVDISFDIALLLKSIFALGEIIGGTAMFFLTPARVNTLLSWFRRSTMTGEKTGFFTHLIVHFSQNFTTNTQYILAVYLLSHGVIKLVTLALLWRKVLWAYPLSLLVFLGFIIYQINEYTQTHSIFMIFVTLVDLIMMILTILEYKNIRENNKKTF
ncbi:DUF2127 domain-containing protein [Lactococcus nasutitermitis]|uniref:DUF2127 domain-containing protein n=1 Tax=Lactococcus nasutitermitis TaxID=1652957 RepID=A0ABV9JI12_9LACT|nr:DUF2127 domain-containing protein [Lactococcus nasutitermitis]